MSMALQRAFTRLVIFVYIVTVCFAKPRSENVDFEHRQHRRHKRDVQEIIRGPDQGPQTGCLDPQSPSNGRVQCEDDGWDLICTGTCLSGWSFPTREDSIQLICDHYDGSWQNDANSYPACVPHCSLPCHNGGRCVAPNTCTCPKNFRGNTCEFPIDACSITDPPANANVSCTHDNTMTRCYVSCQKGYRFETPPADEYSCDIDGDWSPTSNMPDCVPEVTIIPGTNVIPTFVPVTEAPPPPFEEPYCATWGQSHYKTFDSRYYEFSSQCTYVLARDCGLNTFDIHVVNDKSCTANDKCSRAIKMYVGESVLALFRAENGPVVTWNGDAVSIPSSVAGIIVEQIADYIYVRTSLGIKLRWDSWEGIYVEPNDDMIGKMCGLCGTYDGDRSNDFTSIDGNEMRLADGFAESWKMENFDDSCRDVVHPDLCDPSTQSGSMRLRDAQSRCRFLLEPQFTACSEKLDPTPYISACEKDYCSCNSTERSDCPCNSFSEYFRACARIGIKKVPNWRSGQTCPIKCPFGQNYDQCGTSCPKTCANTLDACIGEHCVDGCQCPAGHVVYGDTCLKPNECPCVYQRKEFSSGSIIAQDCNTCKCKSGKWECTKLVCTAMCSTSGDPHIKTFDGKRYNFMGTCSYYLLFDEQYKIIAEYGKCGSLESTCTKSVVIKVGSITVQLKTHKAVLINGVEIAERPQRLPGIRIQEATSIFTLVQLDNGIRIHWDSQSRAYIYAPPEFKDKTLGLCGTFNGNQKDDFTTREGDIEFNSVDFGNKWKVEYLCNNVVDPVADPCEIYTQRKPVAITECAKLKSELFADCHDVVAVDTFYQNCMYDVCECTGSLADCLCPTLGTYADECAKMGVPMQWRQFVTPCAVSCTGGQTYQACASPCGRTCRDININPACVEVCVEGCNCPAGKTLSENNECIPVDECPCIFDEREYESGFITIRGEEVCQCIGAQWKCVPKTDQHDPEKIPPICPEHMVYSDCVPNCPKTCSSIQSDDCDQVHCQAGCQCADGYVMDDSSRVCVKEEECPCMHGGKSFREGDTITMDCNLCTCLNRRWTCETKPCPGICTNWGSSHHITFDGSEFQFAGTCEYVMVASAASNNYKFIVTTENVACGTSGVTCTKSVKFSLGTPGTSSYVEMQLIRDRNIVVPSNAPFSVQEVGLYVFVVTDIGVTLMWDKGTRLYIRLDSRHSGKVEGLCGDYNGDESNDFTPPNGGMPLTKPEDFGESWKVHSYCEKATSVPGACEHSPYRKPWAQKECGIIAGDLFAECHGEVPYQSYLERCIYDTCACDMGGDCECLCTAIAAYAQECTLKGVEVRWRSQELCPMQCEDCMEYQPCVSLCPPRTCENRNEYDSILSTCDDIMCVEGCDYTPCPPGQIFLNNTHPPKCIPEVICRSTCIVNGKEYVEGQPITDPAVCDPCQVCFCEGGYVKKTGTPCSTVSRPITTGPTGVTITPTGITRPSTGLTVTITERPPTGSPTVGTGTTTVGTGPTTPPPSATTPKVGVTTTPTTVTTFEPVCLEDGWTQWMSSFIPTPLNQGDLETYPNLRKAYQFCSFNEITAVQCRVIGTNTMADYSGQTVTCSMDNGLICYNKDQEANTCYDYEVRVYCECTEATTPVVPPSGESTTPSEVTTPGGTLPPGVSTTACEYWSEWMNAYTPDDEGDKELLPTLRGFYDFCESKYISEVRCRAAESQVPSEFTGQDTQCGVEVPGFRCSNDGTPDGTCLDYEIQVKCECTVQGTTPGGEGTTPGEVTGTPKPKTPGTEETQGPTGATTPKPTGPTGQPPTGTPGTGTPGIGSTETPKTPETPVTGTPGSPITGSTEGPGTTETGTPGPSTPGTGGTESTGATTPRPTGPTSKPPTGTTPRVPECERTGWTEWIDTDSPTTGAGDIESVTDIINTVDGMCPQDMVSAIQCRDANTKDGVGLTDDSEVICTIQDGLVCLSSKQADGQCENYEVRFFCKCTEEICDKPIISEDGNIEDSQLSSTGYWGTDPRHGPQRSRLDTVLGPGGYGGWTARVNDQEQWIKVDFGTPIEVAGLVTQGRSDKPEWVKSYRVILSDDNCENFFYMTTEDGTTPKIFDANLDQNTQVKIMFDNIPTTRCIGINPIDWHSAISLRWDVLGCRQPSTPGTPGTTGTEPTEGTPGTGTPGTEKPPT
ncbi:unnamed protein product, partial [Owenia fusiformis]